ncbi:hypothetical protein GCM10009853_077830 [Glycomyces scopariae]
MRDRRLGLPTTAVTAVLSVTVQSLRWVACEGTPLEGVLGRDPLGPWGIGAA